MNVCIIGDGLTSLSLAKNLINKKIKVDIYCNDKINTLSPTRTIGITQNNLDFFKKEVLKISNKHIWEIKKIEIEGYYIEIFAKRDKFGINCNGYVSITNKNSIINKLYLEIQAIDKNEKMISVINFLINDAKINQKINKIKIFNGIKSCAKIKTFNIVAG